MGCEIIYILCSFILCFCILPSWCKTVYGTFATHLAQQNSGQYITAFCFSGETSVIKFKLNGTGFPPSQPKLYLFLEDDWEIAKETKCSKRFDLASVYVDLSNTDGNQTLGIISKTRPWYMMFADAYTCDKERPIFPMEKPNYIQYELSFLNPDSLGNPTDHFGEDERGLFRFYQLLTLMYFVLGCICAPRLHDTLEKRGPMHLVIQLLTVAMALQAVGAFLMMMHLRSYSKDGYGSPFFELLSELLDVLSQIVMLFMLLCLSLGWTLAGTHKPAHSFAKLREKPAARIVVVIGILQGILFIWEQYEERDHMMYHAHRSFAGISLVLMRIFLAAFFALNLYHTIAEERSKLKRDFYASFTKSCMVWFLSYPALVLISQLFSVYLRYKLVTICVVLCQSVAVVMLYRLFLARSLYWEVSALGSLPFKIDRSSKPLKMDKTFGIKLYS